MLVGSIGLWAVPSVCVAGWVRMRPTVFVGVLSRPVGLPPVAQDLPFEPHVQHVHCIHHFNLWRRHRDDYAAAEARALSASAERMADGRRFFSLHAGQIHASLPPNTQTRIGSTSAPLAMSNTASTLSQESLESCRMAHAPVSVCQLSCLRGVNAKAWTANRQRNGEWHVQEHGCAANSIK